MGDRTPAGGRLTAATIARIARASSSGVVA